MTNAFFSHHSRTEGGHYSLASLHRDRHYHQTFIARMNKRGGGPGINTKRHLLTTGEADGEKQSMLRMDNRREHSRMMKIEGNQKRMMGHTEGYFKL